MARIRSIKPEFFQHDGLAQLSIAHRYLFIGLWTMADREGRMVDRPSRIRVAVMPYESATTEDVDAMLWDLAEHPEGFIVRYEVDGCQFIAVRSFTEHQRPHPKDPESTIPAFSVGCVRSRVFPGNSREKRGKPGKSPKPPLSKSPRVQESKSPRRGSAEGGTAPLVWFATLDGFAAFWTAYPSKTGKQPALKAWRHLDAGPDLGLAILAGIEAWARSERWRDGYVCDPATFLNQRRWEDDPPPPKPAKVNGHGPAKPDWRADVDRVFAEEEAKELAAAGGKP